MAESSASVLEHEDIGDQTGQRARVSQSADAAPQAACKVRPKIWLGSAVGILPVDPQQVMCGRRQLTHAGSLGLGSIHQSRTNRAEATIACFKLAVISTVASG